jgi:dihydropyrimidinase
MNLASWTDKPPNDFYRGTIAAALGGVTTIVDFAIQTPGHPVMEAVNKWHDLADGNVVVDYGLHAAVKEATAATLDEINQIVEHGIPCIKVFTTYRAHNSMVDDGELLDIFRCVHRCGGITGVHAENDAIATRNYERFEKDGLRAAKFHALAKPDYVEAEAVNRVIFLAQIAEARLFIHHLSSARGVDIIRKAQQEGQQVLAETCTQYLTLDRSILNRTDGINWICSPPLRDVDDQEALWDALDDGTVSVISTDEAGFNKADKAMAKDGPLNEIPNGIPGVGLRLPVIFTQGVENQRLSLEQFVSLTSTNPARICGLFPLKGIIAPCSDADLIVIDPLRYIKLDAETQQMPFDWCPYEGMDVAGYPKFTISRGKVIVDNYQFCGDRGHGEFVQGRIIEKYLAPLIRRGM